MRLWLKRLRNGQGRTQENVAKAMGVSKQYYNLIELGKTKNIKLETAQKLAKAFGITVENIEKYESLGEGRFLRKDYQGSDEKIERFLINTGVNWRNCLYVTCAVCKYTKEKYCDDFLVKFDCRGCPVVVTAKDAGVLYGRIIDKSECIAEMSNVRFQELFDRFIDQNRCSDELPENKQRCPLLDIADVPLDYFAHGVTKDTTKNESKSVDIK